MTKTEMNKELLTQLYTAFKNRDYVGMGRCYHQDAEFSDPVFPLLKGKQVLAMWHMLVSGGKETKINFSGITTSENEGSCKWQADYPYGEGKKKRMVHNVVESQFQFKDGKIIKQVDSFNLRTWLAMAFGPVGLLLGWTSFMKRKVQKLAAQRLQIFSNNYQEYKS